MASEFHFICLGKLKDSGLANLEHDFLKRLRHFPLQIHELKASAERPDAEAAEVLHSIQKISPRQKPFIILLDEKGSSFTSVEMAKWILDLSTGAKSKVIFCLGGAQGHGLALRHQADALLALGPLTLPHRLARLVFVEQFYRAYTLNTGHPYHNA